MTTIFHAFNIPYKQIEDLAPHLREMGFTHIQFPPIQESRILTELDADLLSVFRSRDLYIKQFQSQLEKAYQKNSLYPLHNFHFLLDMYIQYIQQPTIKQLYSGEHPNNPSYHFFISVIQTGSSHPFYPLIEAAECVLQWKPLRPFSPEKLHKLQDTQTTVQSMLKNNRTQDLLQQYSVLKKQILQELTKQTVWEKQTAIRQTLRRLVPVTERLRQQLRNDGIPDVANVSPISEKKTKHIEDIVCMCEVLLIPDWWMIYQPIKLDIGQTHLGSKEDILDAIHVCKRNGLSVIADVVVNNLAATAGEKQSWELVLQKAKKQRAVLLSDVHLDEGEDIEAIRRVQELLEGAFGSRDLSLLTAPYECREDQDPTRCWMSGCLPQLNPANLIVREKQKVFLQSLLNAGVDGIRVDAAAHLTPDHCEWLLSFFPGLSYIEYVGPNSSAYRVRKEDFAIGDDILSNIFSVKGYLAKTTNYGEHTLHRLEPDSVTMIINHDQIMGTIPSTVMNELPSQVTYLLSLAYLIQRIYGTPLLLPHDIEQPFVYDALQLRKRLFGADIVREYVSITDNVIQIDKYDAENIRQFVVYINMNEVGKNVAEGFIEPLSFQWFALESNNTRIVYNNHQHKMMKRCYTRTNRVKGRYTRKKLDQQTLKKVQQSKLNKY